MRKLAVATIASFLSACAQSAPSENQAAHHTLLPGSPELNTTALAVGEYRYVNGTGGTMAINVGRENYDGGDVFRAEVWFNSEVGVDEPDLIRFDAEGFGLATRSFAISGQYRIDVRVTEDNRFVGSLTPEAGSGYSPRTYDRPYPNNGFEPSVLFLYMSSLPLSEGYTVSIPTFDLNEGSLMIWADIEVERRERIRIGGRTYDTLRVVSDGVRRKTFWMVDGMALPIRMRTAGSPTAWTLEASPDR